MCVFQLNIWRFKSIFYTYIFYTYLLYTFHFCLLQLFIILPPPAPFDTYQMRSEARASGETKGWVTMAKAICGFFF
jgi:hypothetical protein